MGKENSRSQTRNENSRVRTIVPGLEGGGGIHGTSRATASQSEFTANTFSFLSYTDTHAPRPSDLTSKLSPPFRCNEGGHTHTGTERNLPG